MAKLMNDREKLNWGMLHGWVVAFPQNESRIQVLPSLAQPNQSLFRVIHDQPSTAHE
jgi:hypothetical protein